MERLRLASATWKGGTSTHLRTEGCPLETAISSGLKSLGARVLLDLPCPICLPGLLPWRTNSLVAEPRPPELLEPHWPARILEKFTW